MTPIMRQFTDIKAKHPDAILLFSVGDFNTSHYLSDYGEWLINIANGELITDPEDINSIVL